MTPVRPRTRLRASGGPQGSLVASPILVGAATVLVVVVGVFLSYNANRGLPFVPTSQLRMQLASGANLNRDQEVREGGYRIGVIERLEPIVLPSGRAGAEVVLKLDKSAGSIPVDSRFAVRARGVAGAKYIEITRGRSARHFPDGGTVPVRQTRFGLELDQAISAFDPATRAGVRRVLYGLGNGLASRGADLNTTLGNLPRLLTLTAPVMRNLADPRTDLDGLIGSVDRAMTLLAPVAGPQAHAFAAMADTLDALSRDPQALDQTIARTPGTLAAATSSLRASRPFLHHTATLMGTLKPVSQRLRTALPPINAALDRAPGPLGRTPALSERLGGALSQLGSLSGDPATGVALRGLTATVTTVQPQLRFYGPWVTACEMPQLWLAFVPDVLSVPDSTGFSQRGLVQTTDAQHDDLSVMGANEFATGRGVRPGGVPNHLHANFLPNVVDAKGNTDCAPGQSGYASGRNPFDTTPDRYYRRAVVENPPAGPYGPLWRFDKRGRPRGFGPKRLAEGQTFTVTPGGRGAPETP